MARSLMLGCDALAYANIGALSYAKRPGRVRERGLRGGRCEGFGA